MSAEYWVLRRRASSRARRLASVLRVVCSDRQDRVHESRLAVWRWVDECSQSDIEEDKHLRACSSLR
jgi:hypothetical protein